MNADQIDHRAIIASLSASDRALLTGLTNRDGILRAAFHFGAIAVARRGDPRPHSVLAAAAAVAGHPHRLPVHGDARDHPRHGVPIRLAEPGRVDDLRLSDLHSASVVPLFPFRASPPHARSRQRSRADEPQAGNRRAIRALFLRAAAVDRHGQGDRRQRGRHCGRALRSREGQGQGAAGSAHHRLPPMRRSPWPRSHSGRRRCCGCGSCRSLLGQPFLRAYLLAEHARCPHVANMLENTRTTFTTALVRLIAWNMPFHAEHHAYPAVPFHKLPRFPRGRRRASADNRARLHHLPSQIRRRSQVRSRGQFTFLPLARVLSGLIFARRAKPIMKRSRLPPFRSQQ